MMVLLNGTASVVRSLNLCLMGKHQISEKNLRHNNIVYMSLAFGASPVFPEFSDGPCVFKLRSQNFRISLSWELKSYHIVPTHYTLWNTVMSKEEDMSIAENCVNITTPFCDLTDEWHEMYETYLLRLEGFHGEAVVVNCSQSFMATDVLYEPPEFEIIGFQDSILVTMKFPPVIPKIFGEEVQNYLLLIIKVQSGGIVKLHKPQINKSVNGNLSYVIDNLIPNTTYCISVYFEPRNQRKSIKSPLKCILLPPVLESEPSESAKISGIIVVFLIAVVFISTIITLKRIGYICLNNSFPKVLNFYNFVAQILPTLPPSEAVDMVEVIHVNRKKKVWNYDYDDESDSEEVVPRTNPGGGYTMHGLMGGLLSQAAPTSPQGSLAVDSGAEESDPLEAEAEESEPEPPADPGPSAWQSEDTGGPLERKCKLQDSYSEDGGSSPERSGDRIAFNVDLNSVFMRAPDDESEEEDTLMLSLPEETPGLGEDLHQMEPSLLVASGEQTQLLPPSLSLQGLWMEDDPSDKSDTSDSDADYGRDGYIMR